MGKVTSCLPIVSNYDHLLNAFMVENVRQVVAVAFEAVRLDVGRLTGTAVTEQIGANNAVTLLAKVLDLIPPAVGTLREAVEKEQSWFAGVGDGAVVGVGETPLGLGRFDIDWSHGFAREVGLARTWNL
jgi:hypothetical protein